jgi:hypothetical protein
MMSSSIPDEAIEQANQELRQFKRFGVQGRFEGRYLYITARGDPLCRYRWTGDPKKWEFALYRYSRGGYSRKVEFFPDRGELSEGIRMSLNLYEIHPRGTVGNAAAALWRWMMRRTLRRVLTSLRS